MGIHKFLLHIKHSFQFDTLQKTKKRASIEHLLKKLKTKKETLKNMLKETRSKEDLTAINETLAIIALQIQKGENILKKLDT